MDLSRRRFILIAEDNPDLASTLSLLLRMVGFDAQAVHDGRDAVRAAQARRPDVLLLDIGLPGLNGYEVARQFRSDERLKGVFIIAHSAYPPDTVPGRSHERDFDHYLVKPVDFQTLLPLLGRPG